MTTRPFILQGVLLALLSLAQAYSQESTIAQGKIAVTSNSVKASVFVDSTFVGVTPLEAFPVMPGRHVVCVGPGESKSWAAGHSCEEIQVEAGAEVRVSLDVPRSILVASEPYGATVSYRDSVLGKTPFILSTNAESGTITVSKDGYESLSLLFDGTTSFLDCSLVAKRGVKPEPQALYLDTEESKSALPLIVTASTAVVAGVAAAYFKIRADNLYNEYKISGNAAQLNRIRQFDLASGAALAASQISLALLTYFLLSR